MKDYILDHSQEIIALGENLFNHPELGYKEFTNKKTLIEYFKKYGFKIENECFETAFSVSIGKGKPHIGLIAELDGLPMGDGFRHACGHSTQCAIQAAVMISLKQRELTKGKVTLFFTPGEEYIDIAYRKKLIKDKKIEYIGGKQNMIAKGLFDDVDFFIHLHTSSNRQYQYNLNTTLGGFVYKKYSFIGKASHAAVKPELGVNAINMFTLFNNAVNALRETFKDEDGVRVHGYISNGGSSINIIPDKLVYECYIRSYNIDTINEVSKKIDNAAKCCAKALGGSVKIETLPGYVPLVQSKPLTEYIYQYLLKQYKPEEIKLNGKSMAAGDLGDLSLFKPVVQIGYGGFKGMVHGKDLDIEDPNRVYIKTAKVIEGVVLGLLKDQEAVKKIKADFKPRMKKEDYLKMIKIKG